MDIASIAIIAIAAALLGAAAGYFIRHQSAQQQAAESAEQVSKLLRIRKAAGERLAQMRDQIVGLTKTVEELRRTLRNAEAELRRRESLDRALERSPCEPAAEQAANVESREGPRVTFADTQVMDK